MSGIINTGTELQGRYVIGESLGSGGFAVVWRARDKQLGRDVAIKRLLHLEQNQKERLLQEARHTVQLGGHQNIVQVYDVIEEGNEALLVMEFVPGETLERVCQRHIREGGWLDQEDALDYFKQILQGLVFAHQRSLCHRDIKPSNILISNLGIVKLVDFGLAKTLDELRTQATVESGFAWSGTMDYMSPEQASGQSMGQQSDVFSAGIVGYILLCARHPFNHPSAVLSVFDLIKEPAFECLQPNSPSGFQISEQTVNVLLKMLRKKKTERYQAILEAFSDLTREPIQTCPNCGAPNSLASRFCGRCGHALQEAPQHQPPKQAPSAGVEKPKTAKEVGDEGFRFSKEGDWEKAIQKYREAISINPKFGLVYRNLGYALNRIGQFEEAIKVLTKAIGLATQDAPLYGIYDLLGFSKMNLKDYAGAAVDFTSSLKYNASDARVFIHRAEALAQLGEFPKALQDVNKALSLDPANRHAVRLKTRLEAEDAR